MDAKDVEHFFEIFWRKVQYDVINLGKWLWLRMGVRSCQTMVNIRFVFQDEDS